MLQAWPLGRQALQGGGVVLKRVAAVSPAPGRMMSLQQGLPTLPVPPLQQTLDRYLDVVKPLYSDEDYKHAEKVGGEMFCLK